MWRLRGPDKLTGAFAVLDEEGQIHTDGHTEADGDKVRLMVKAANGYPALVKALNQAKHALRHAHSVEEQAARRVVVEALKEVGEDK